MDAAGSPSEPILDRFWVVFRLLFARCLFLFVEQVGSGHNAIIENTTFCFFLSCRGGRVAKFHFAPPTLACFFLT